MELTNEVKEMVGKEYLFSGNFLDTFDRVEESYLVLDAKPTDWKIKKENGDVFNTFKLLIKNDKMVKARWTKAFSMSKIN